jgi:uncharacterized membrane-anchored protein
VTSTDLLGAELGLASVIILVVLGVAMLAMVAAWPLRKRPRQIKPGQKG